MLKKVISAVLCMMLFCSFITAFAEEESFNTLLEYSGSDADNWVKSNDKAGATELEGVGNVLTAFGSGANLIREFSPIDKGTVAVSFDYCAAEGNGHGTRIRFYDGKDILFHVRADIDKYFSIMSEEGGGALSYDPEKSVGTEGDKILANHWYRVKILFDYTAKNQGVENWITVSVFKHGTDGSEYNPASLTPYGEIKGTSLTGTTFSKIQFVYVEGGAKYFANFNVSADERAYVCTLEGMIGMAKNLYEAEYTPSSWAKLKTAVNNASEVSASSASSFQDYIKAYESLTEAVDSLESKPIVLLAGDDFESAASYSDKAVTPSGFTVISSGSSTVSTVSDAEKGDVLRLSSPGTGQAAITYKSTDAIKNRISLTADYKFSSLSSGTVAARIMDSEERRIGEVKLNNFEGYVSLVYVDYYTGYIDKVAKIEPDKWYNIKTELNTLSDVLTVYIDGKAVYSNTLYAGENVTIAPYQMKIATPYWLAQTLFVDNVRVETI